MLSVIKTNPWLNYDHWLDTDILGDIEFRDECELEWVKSLIGLDHPHMSDEDVEIMAQHRIDNGYYATLDF